MNLDIYLDSGRTVAQATLTWSAFAGYCYGTVTGGPGNSRKSQIPKFETKLLAKHLFEAQYQASNH
jgi:hypothetical protein